jgi:hypothetical protein
MDTLDRSYLSFEIKVRKAFAFLGNLGFSEIEALPTLVRYRKGNVEVDIYHGRQSYEIGAGVTAFGTRYAISELIRVIDPEVANQFRYSKATTPEAMVSGLEGLSSLMKRYGSVALRGDSQFISMLEKQRKCWAEEYALDVLAEQIRPQADEAFRRKDYSIAVELYSRIRQRLSPAELKKLSFAEKHRQE